MISMIVCQVTHTLFLTISRSSSLKKKKKNTPEVYYFRYQFKLEGVLCPQGLVREWEYIQNTFSGFFTLVTLIMQYLLSLSVAIYSEYGHGSSEILQLDLPFFMLSLVRAVPYLFPIGFLLTNSRSLPTLTLLEYTSVGGGGGG